MDRLARFSGVSVGDVRSFGGGAERAEVHYRGETVAYGYLAVLDGYRDSATGTPWCTLTVTLPGQLPRVTVDHRSALGRPGVPADGWQQPAVGNPAFDQDYLITVDGGVDAAGLVSSGVQEALLRQPVQRLALFGASLVLRTFDGAVPGEDVTRWLEQLAAAVLATTPGFITPMGTRTFPPGLYGPNVADDDEAEVGRGLFARFGRRTGRAGRG